MECFKTSQGGTYLSDWVLWETEARLQIGAQLRQFSSLARPALKIKNRKDWDAAEWKGPYFQS